MCEMAEPISFTSNHQLSMAAGSVIRWSSLHQSVCFNSTSGKDRASSERQLSNSSSSSTRWKLYTNADRFLFADIQLELVELIE